MKTFKKTLLTIAVMASIAALAGCGGDNDQVGIGGAKSAAVDSIEGAEDLQSTDSAMASQPAPTGEIAPKVATWQAMTDDASPMSKSLMLAGLDVVTPATLARGMSKHASVADGLVLNVDNPPGDWELVVKSALKSGQTVVLISSGSGNALHDASLKLTGIGFQGANAIMVLQGNPEEESYGLLPFHANEMKELVGFMESAVRRVIVAS